jgi:hypothetical protein
MASQSPGSNKTTIYIKIDVSTAILLSSSGKSKNKIASFLYNFNDCRLMKICWVYWDFRAEEGGVDYRNVIENLNFLSTVRLIVDKLNISSIK